MKDLLRLVRRRSMVRRTLLALSIAFVGVGTTLMAVDFVVFKHTMSRSPGIRQLAEANVASLARRPDERDAALVLEVLAEQLNTERRKVPALPGDVLFQLRRADGRIVFTSPALAAVQPAVAVGDVAVLDFAGRPHWTVQAAAGPWRLYVAEPRVPDVAVLAWIGSDLLPSLLIAFALVLVPLAVAVHRGMRPLRHLAAVLDARRPDDLSPLGISPRHEELKPLVAAFELVLGRLRQQVLRERAFVHDAAHELRTPMAVIAAQAHLLARSADAGDRREAATALDQALDRASNLSRQLLDLAVLDDGRHREPDTFDAAELVQMQLAHCAAQALGRGLDLTLDAPDHLPCVMDRVAFLSVVGNLLENALRYVPGGGRVAVSLQRTDGVLTLSVADDGPGLSAVERAQAFERFWRGPQHAVPGSGLGLAIVQQAASRLGGRVHIEDGLDGRGVCFVLRVPDPT